MAQYEIERFRYKCFVEGMALVGELLDHDEFRGLGRAYELLDDRLWYVMPIETPSRG